MNNEKTVYQLAKEFKKRHPFTIAWRIKAHSKIVEKYLNPGEVVKYVFTAQKNATTFDIISTYVFALTNKRLIYGQKRFFFGHFYNAITPDMFNDIEVKMGIMWGTVTIDSVKEVVHIAKLQKSSLDEIETNVTEYFMRERKRHLQPHNNEK